MIAPILSRKDGTIVSDYTLNPPQSMLIVGEPGLDADLLLYKLAETEPSDVLKLLPEADKKTIGVMQVREVIGRLSTHAIRRRVVLVPQADIMTEEAQNALLKTLEEPNKNTYFILSTDDEYAMLQTIRSRCQTVRLHRTSPSQDSRLLDGAKLSEQEKQQILFLASGRPALIRQMTNNPRILKEYQEVATDAKKIMQGRSYDAAQLVHKYSSSRVEASRLIDVLLTMIRFQSRSVDGVRSSSALLEKTCLAESRLKSNGNVKLVLLQLVV